MVDLAVKTDELQRVEIWINDMTREGQDEVLDDA